MHRVVALLLLAGLGVIAGACGGNSGSTTTGPTVRAPSLPAPQPTTTGSTTSP